MDDLCCEGVSEGVSTEGAIGGRLGEDTSPGTSPIGQAGSLRTKRMSRLERAVARDPENQAIAIDLARLCLRLRKAEHAANLMEPALLHLLARAQQIGNPRAAEILRRFQEARQRERSVRTRYR